jgi:hypothetical protein
VEAIAANVHDVMMAPKLLTGEEESVYGDSGHLDAEKREDAIRRNKEGKKDTPQNEPKALAKQTQIVAIQGADQTAKAREIISTGKGRACIRRCEGIVQVSQNTIQRPTKTGCEVDYDVRVGQPVSGG